MFITNNIIPGYNSEISTFMFPFGCVAKQSLAKVRNNLSEHPTNGSTLLEEEALFEFFLPKNVLWFPAIVCLGLSSAVLFAPDVQDVEFSRIVPWVQKVYSFFPNSW